MKTERQKAQAMYEYGEQRLLLINKCLDEITESLEEDPLVSPLLSGTISFIMDERQHCIERMNDFNRHYNLGKEELV